MTQLIKHLKRLVIIVFIIGGFVGLSVLAINTHVKSTAEKKIVSSEEAANLEDIDCILVLGCQVKEDGTPSLMLRDRLNCGIDLYEKRYEVFGVSKLLMSGDHGRKEYNEVATMKNYAMDAGISSEDIFMDHAGFSTYESIYRAKEIFGVDKMIIVTQDYHLYRALYVAEKLGIESYGVAAGNQVYYGQAMRDFREVLARTKDFATTILKPKPTYLGEFISIKGDGNLTND